MHYYRILLVWYLIATQALAGSLGFSSMMSARDSTAIHTGDAAGGSLSGTFPNPDLGNSVTNASGNLTVAPKANLVLNPAGSGTVQVSSGDSLTVDIVSATTAATAFQIRETSGLTLSNDAGTANTITTFTPGTNTLAVDVAGTGLISIATGDSLSVDTIATTGDVNLVLTAGATNRNIVLTPTGTGSTTTAKSINVTAGQVNVDTVSAVSTNTDLTLKPNGTASNVIVLAGKTLTTDKITASTAATAVSILETSGIIFGDDSATAATLATFTPGTNALALAIAGTGAFTIDSSDTLKVNAITTITDADITITGGATNRNVNLTPTGTGQTIVAAGKTIAADTLTASSANTNVTLQASGTARQIVIPANHSLTLTGQSGTPGTFATGGISFDTALNSLIFQSGLGVLQQPQVFFKSTAQIGSLTNPTSLTSFGTIKSIPASSLKAGATIHFYGGGLTSPQGNASQTLGIDIQLNGVTVATVLNNGAIARVSTQTNIGWAFHSEVYCRTVGASGSLTSNSHIDIGQPGSTGLGNTAAFEANNTGATTVDTTATLPITLRAAFGVSNASNSVSLDNLTVDIK